MFKPVTFDEPVESLVRFVEETDPADMLDATYQRLRAGADPVDIIRASTLAVVRSTEVPPNHHGGPVHPVCGVRAVHEVSKRLDGEQQWLPILQHAALCNNHVHSPQMGPYLMPEIEPMAGKPGDVGSYHMSDTDLTEGMTEEQREAVVGIEATKGALIRSLRGMAAPAAEHYFLWLVDQVSPSEALDQLLPIAIGRNGLDDHNFLFPVYTARTLDIIGWEWAGVMFRPPIRYQARRSPRLMRNEYHFKDVEALIADYGLVEMDIADDSHEGETDAILALARRLGEQKDYLSNVGVMAEALRDGLSLAGAGEALSIGAASAYLATSYGNPMDSHLHTGTNNRRYLLNQPGVSKRNKILGLCTAFTGPEVLLAQRMLNWDDILDVGIGHLKQRSQEQLLDDIVASIEGVPWLDWRKIGVDNTVAPDEVRDTVMLARQYADAGYDPEVYFNRLADVACRDDFTEMHSLKHFQAIVDEYYMTRPSHRWLHLVAAAKSAAVVHVGKEHQVYEAAKSLIAA